MNQYVNNGVAVFERELAHVSDVLKGAPPLISFRFGGLVTFLAFSAPSSQRHITRVFASFFGLFLEYRHVKLRYYTSANDSWGWCDISLGCGKKLRHIVRKNFRAVPTIRDNPVGN